MRLPRGSSEAWPKRIGQAEYLSGVLYIRSPRWNRRPGRKTGRKGFGAAGSHTLRAFISLGKGKWNGRREVKVLKDGRRRGRGDPAAGNDESFRCIKRDREYQLASGGSE